MKAKLLNDRPEKTFALIFDTGDEVMKSLKEFTAIGAFQEVTLGYFDWQKKDYQHIPLAEQVEVLSLLGDVGRDEQGQPALHAHVVVGRRDGTAHGGHLLEAVVRPTLELILVESPQYLQRERDRTTGLALVRL
jgi:predicted DNA-binding protein with PD1-like motif